MNLRPGFARLASRFIDVRAFMSESWARPFLRPLKILLLLVLGLLVFAATLVLTVPAGWLWQQVEDRLPLPEDIRVQQVSGHLWDGAARIVVIGYPALVEWRLLRPSLSDQTLPVDLRVQTSQSEVRADAQLAWPVQINAKADGHIAVAEFRDLIRQSGGAMIEGDVDIQRLVVRWSGEALPELQGQARWPGGLVTWPMGSERGSADFPPMQANLEGNGRSAELLISEQGASGPAAQAALRPDGMMEIRVFKRMVDLAGQDWSNSAGPGDVVFRVRQPLIPGGF